ncbi:MAG: FAD-dependent oxidoreductase [Betaproteobacteria bacterium]
MPSSTIPARVVVVGAGAVGMACALTLRREGHAVTVLDPRLPGTAASFGNAGIIANCAVDPVGMPGILRQAPSMLMDRSGPLIIRWRYLPHLLPWLVRFVAASRPARVEAISRALHSLLGNAAQTWHELVRGTEAQRYLEQRGWIHAYESDDAFAATAPVLELRRRRGVRFEILTADELRQLEPAAGSIFRRAVYLPDTGFVTSPARLVRGVAEAFVAAGGTLTRERVTGFVRNGQGVTAVRTERDVHAAQHVIIAAGAWSRPLAAMLGSRVPLDTERGYHVMLPEPRNPLRHPLSSGERKFLLLPMQDGIRLTGGVEFAGLDAPPDFTRIRRMVSHAQRMLPGLSEDIQSEWLGFRPSMPDSLPVIGAAPACPGALFAFGHGHVGLTSAASTAVLIADLVAGRQPMIDVGAFRADRFLF